MRGLFEIVFDEDVGGALHRHRAHVAGVHIPVAVEVEAQSDASCGSSHRVSWPHPDRPDHRQTAFPRDDLARDIANRLHGPPSMLRFAWGTRNHGGSLKFD
jgi:hypothetical protein